MRCIFLKTDNDSNKRRKKRERLTISRLIAILFLLLSVTLLVGCSRKQVTASELKDQLDEFIIASKADGSLESIANDWLTGDAEERGLDFDALKGENGTITVGTKTSLPFSYLKEGKHVGIVPDILLHFCGKYGYKLEFMDFRDVNSIILAISSGKCDLGGASITVTEERKKMVNFSEPFFDSSGVIVMNREEAAEFKDVSSISGKKVGTITGSVYHDVIEKKIASAEVFEYSAAADLCQALNNHKIDAIVYDYAVITVALRNYPTETIVGTLTDDDKFAFVFPKASAETGGWFAQIAESFHRTMIQDNRWQQILKGIGMTLLITAAAILIGSALGFFLCNASRGKNKTVIKLIAGFSWLIRGLPTVVLLMIMYYVVFGSTPVSGTAVSVISFSLIFGVTVCGLLTSGIRSVDRGQFEACIALGYTEKEGFRKLILPQAIRFSVPGFKNEIIALIKATSIVGYIAVQDLTKTGDIIRSSTYEAFFPLILTAVIYFVLAWALVRIVDGIQLRAFSRNEQEKFLKWVTRHA